jgi:transcriptional regulator with XRE-family HTH domain
MLAPRYGKYIREQRLRKGLKQEELAERAGVSRAVLSALECGKPKPVQSDTIDRLCAALEVEPRLDGPGPDAARKLARLEHEIRRRDRREKHLRLAVELAADDRRASEKIAKARARVQLWREKKSCSPFYIQRWSRMLAKPPQALAKEMSSLGEWEDALFQNSPWSAVWT